MTFRRGAVLGAVALGALTGGGAYLAYTALTTTAPTRAGLAYGEASSRQVLDLYLPEGAAAEPPVVLWVHGGAFMMGDKSDPQSLDALLGAGFAVASMNYRLSGEAIWPAQLEDVTAAYSLLRGQATELGIDPDRIALFGASAGGFLVSTAGITLTAAGEAPVAVVDWFGPVQFSTMDADMEASGQPRSTGRNDAADSPESALIGVPVGENRDLADSIGPLAEIARLPAGVTLPPFLILHGGVDTYVAPAQSERLRDAIAASPANGGVEYVLLPDGGHGSGAFQTAAATDRVLAFLRERFDPR
jgi:acetyl esterase/lipase